MQYMYNINTKLTTMIKTSAVTKHTITWFLPGFCGGLSQFANVFSPKHGSFVQTIFISYLQATHIFNARLHQHSAACLHGTQFYGHCTIFSYQHGLHTPGYRSVALSNTHCLLIAQWCTFKKSTNTFVPSWHTTLMRNTQMKIRHQLNIQWPGWGSEQCRAASSSAPTSHQISGGQCSWFWTLK